jgi:Ca2+-binding RTX toxin-like protein
MYGGEGIDELNGDDGNDYLQGDAGNDTLSGGENNDTLVGGDGNDTMDGGGGNDLLIGGADDDTMTGASGDDGFNCSGGGNDSLDPGIGKFDYVNFNSSTATSFNLTSNSLEAGGETKTLLGIFDQYFLTGNELANTFKIDGFFPYVSVDPGPTGGIDKLIVKTDAAVIRPNGSLSAYTISLASADFATLGTIKWSGRGVNSLEILGGDADNEVVLDQWSSVIDKLDGGGGVNTLSLTRDANMTLKDGQLDVTTGPLSTIKFQNFGYASLAGGAGNNRLDASAFNGRVSLYGGAGNDTLIGTPNDDILSDDIGNDILMGMGGNDVLTGGDGNDTLDGGDGNQDRIIEALPVTGSTKFVLTNAKLTGRGTDKLVSIEGAELRGREGNDTFDVGAFTGNASNSIIGNGGVDSVVATANVDFELKAGATADASQLSVGLRVWKLTSVESAKLTGGSSANIFAIDDLHVPGHFSAGISILGGGGTDTFHHWPLVVDNGDKLILTNSKVTVDGVAQPVSLNSIEMADLLGEYLYDVSGWTKSAKIIGDDGGRIVSTNPGTFTLSEGLLTRSDKASIQFEELIQGDAITLIGTSAANKFIINDDGNLPGVQIDGGGGVDTLTITIAEASGDDEFEIDESDVNVDLVGVGEGGEFKTIQHQAVEQVTLVGSSRADSFGMEGVDALSSATKYTLNGGGGTDHLNYTSLGSLDVLLANASLSLRQPGQTNIVRTFVLTSIEDAMIDPDGWTILVDVSGWTHTAQIAPAGNVTLVSSADANAVLTDSALTRSNGANISLIGVALVEARISGGKSANTLDASGYSRLVVLRGGAGNDTLIGGSGGDSLFGEDGNDSLDGGAGTDTLDGGVGTDKHKQGETVVNCEQAWT